MKNISNRPNFLFDEEDDNKSSSSKYDRYTSPLTLNLVGDPTDDDILKQITTVKDNFNHMTKEQVIDAIPEEVRNVLSRGASIAGQTLSDDDLYSYMQNYINNLNLDFVKSTLESKMQMNNQKSEDELIDELKSMIKDTVGNVVNDFVGSLSESLDNDIAELEEMPWNEAYNKDPAVAMIRSTSSRIYGDDGETGKSLLGKNAKFFKDIPRHTGLIYVAIYDIGSYDSSAETNDIKIQLRDDENVIITPNNSNDIIGKDIKIWMAKWNIIFEPDSKSYLLQATQEDLIKKYNEDPIEDLGNNYGGIVYDTMNESMVNNLTKNKEELTKLMESPDSEKLISMINEYDEDKDDPEEFNKKLNDLDIHEDLKTKFKKKIKNSDLIKDIIQSSTGLNGSKSRIHYTVMDNYGIDEHPSANINLLTNNSIFSSIEVEQTKNIEKVFLKEFKIKDVEKFTYEAISKSNLIEKHYGPSFDMTQYSKGFIEEITNTDKFVLCFFNHIDSTKTGLYIAYAKSTSGNWIEYIPEFYNGFNPNTLEPFSILDNPEYFDEDNILKGQDTSNVRLSADFALWYKEDGTFRLGDLGKLRVLMDNRLNVKKYFYIGKLYLNNSELSTIFKQDHNVIDDTINIYMKCPESIDSTTYSTYFLSTLMHLAMDINSKDIIKNTVLKFSGPLCYIDLHLDDYEDFLIND